jgi:hypothetical protein
LNVNGPPVTVSVGVTGAFDTTRVTLTVCGLLATPEAVSVTKPLYVLGDRPAGFTDMLNGVFEVLSVPEEGMTCSQGALPDALKLALPVLTDASTL